MGVVIRPTQRVWGESFELFHVNCAENAGQALSLSMVSYGWSPHFPYRQQRPNLRILPPGIHLTKAEAHRGCSVHVSCFLKKNKGMKQSYSQLGHS
jgi:hypothetical protein